jgi:hypothetical protein
LIKPFDPKGIEKIRKGNFPEEYPISIKNILENTRGQIFNKPGKIISKI